MIRRIAQSLPTRESIQANRWLRWMGPALAHPRLWHMSRKGIAAGLALGLFFGLLVPIAQIPLAATAAVVLRANLPVAIGSTLVTNPVTFGPVYYGAYKLGDWLLHRGDGPVRSPDVLEARLQQLHEAPAPIVEANGVAGHIRAIWTRITALGKPLILGLVILATATGVGVYLLTTWVWAAMIWLKRRRRLVRRREPVK
jgi:uncharacterized protein (DUF2062 family)